MTQFPANKAFLFINFIVYTLMAFQLFFGKIMVEEIFLM